ncbi:MAG TPA: ATP-binding protein [Polaromonas sp.]|uniref:sensor histidine kinase n=1 Tax=Polaromonas sp. TaxID=1869339 RepID=UPI002D4949AD|nr:ATP-binding protein [Polaromonas sp.]HYW56970.1 ATP-binding protein [Polaromonas sp.]
MPAWRRRWSRRWGLWVLLVALLVALLSTLVWLAGRYESSQVQSRLEQDAAQTATDIRAALTRNIQGFQALQASSPTPDSWLGPAAELLRTHREMVRVEWRDAALTPVAHVETPYRTSVFEKLGRDSSFTDVSFACAAARRFSGPAYSSSYFLPQADGLGLEVLDMCLPVLFAGQLTGYLVATYSLPEILSELVGKQVARDQGVAFTEADGTRLAMYGSPARGSRAYVAQQLLDLPGNTLVVRLESRLGTPALFPNLLTALVAAMSLALVAVLTLLGRDMRRRLKVEHDLAEALAFRKAMEDSLVTGMRARDLQGRVTYVNPAFCQMVGLEAKELLQQSTPPPYWPPEQVSEYQKRQASRLSVGANLPREGFESVFMRRDGARFPVLIIEAPLINAVGKQTGWMSAVLDVSEQRRIEELSRTSQDRLQATARLATVGEMASLLSHELNQPLAAISSYATGSLNLLQSASESPGEAGTLPHSEDLQQAMRRIAEQAERAGKVIKSVHDFVRRRDQVREPIAPRALLDAVMPLVSLQARKLGVRVLMQVDETCGPVVCDRTMVEQVLLNLARNGMQAMQGLDTSQIEKLLTLRVRPAASNAQSRWVEFAVIDQGEGIPENVAQQLFTPFFTTKAEGMGLGLSLCRTVIEQHGGFLGFEPGQPRGTIFTFTLPVATATASAPAALLA